MSDDAQPPPRKVAKRYSGGLPSLPIYASQRSHPMSLAAAASPDAPRTSDVTQTEHAAPARPFLGASLPPRPSRSSPRPLHSSAFWPSPFVAPRPRLPRSAPDPQSTELPLQAPWWGPRVAPQVQEGRPLAAPAPRPAPRSLLAQPVPPAPAQVPLALPASLPLAAHGPPVPVGPLPAPRISEAEPSTSRGRSAARRAACESRWVAVLQACGPASSLFQAISASENFSEHAARIIAKFTPSTLERHLSVAEELLCHAQFTCMGVHRLSVTGLADFLQACRHARRQDREAPAGAQGALSAVRWLARYADCPALQSLVDTPLIASFFSNSVPRDRREAMLSLIHI